VSFTVLDFPVDNVEAEVDHLSAAPERIAVAG